MNFNNRTTRVVSHSQCETASSTTTTTSFWRLFSHSITTTIGSRGQWTDSSLVGMDLERRGAKIRHFLGNASIRKGRILWIVVQISRVANGRDFHHDLRQLVRHAVWGCCAQWLCEGSVVSRRRRDHRTNKNMREIHLGQDKLIFAVKRLHFAYLSRTRFLSSSNSFLVVDSLIFFQCTMTAWTGVGLHAKDFSLGPFDVSVGCSYSAPFAFTAKMDTAYTTRMDCNDSYTRTFFRRGACCWNEWWWKVVSKHINRIYVCVCVKFFESEKAACHVATHKIQRSPVKEKLHLSAIFGQIFGIFVLLPTGLNKKIFRDHPIFLLDPSHCSIIREEVCCCALCSTHCSR